jgi:cytochrome c556
MKRLMCMASVLGFLVASVLVTGRAGAGDTETPAIKDVMKALHKGPNSPLAKLKTSLKADAPNWKEIQDNTKQFVALGVALPKNDAPKGDNENYKKLASAYFDSAKALDDSAKKENLAATQEAYKTISSSCMPCHKAHRPPN